jgi:putative heme-binding domain-containing protein
MHRNAITAFVVASITAGASAQAPPPEPKSPEESARSFRVPTDLRFDQVLREPDVCQPVSIRFDERGRLWVVEYLQYPHPAGLKLLSRDNHWRAVYDKVPAAPPNHVRGADRISIHEDTNGDGVYDNHSIFVDGLNIATSLAHGRGGVWVLNPPYLLFYPSKSGDRPDGDPVVHLQGFGLEDTHSCANSLRWGPDGWLYGAHGSTVTARITIPGEKRPPVTMIGQHIWRYHPETKRFEVFAEGGGNAFGVEFDEFGRVFSGHNGGDTRGFHYVGGGYYRKGFEKHGVLANPYAFGFFEAMAHNKAQRFSHAFVIAQGVSLPEKYRGKLLAIEPLQGRVMLSEFEPDRSTFKTRDLDPVVQSSDPRFRPVDIQRGPDGALYVADFHEAKIAHLDHYAGRIERDTGRVYRLGDIAGKPNRIDLSRRSSAELIELLKGDNRWAAESSLRLLGDRRDATAIPPLKAVLMKSSGRTAVRALWGIHLSGGFDEKLGATLVSHPEPQVRAWTIRLLGDAERFGSLAGTIADLARTESSVDVRSQLASSARRVPVAEGLPIIAALLRSDADADDPHVPLLLWWSIERAVGIDPAAVLSMFRESDLWRGRIAREVIVPRLAKRFAMSGSRRDLEACAKLLKLAPERQLALLVLTGIEEGLRGRSIAGLPENLLAEVAKLGGGSISLRIHLNQTPAIDEAITKIRDPRTPLTERIALIENFRTAVVAKAVPALLEIVQRDNVPELQVAALAALQSYGDDSIARDILGQFAKMSGGPRNAAEALLVARKSWSWQLLRAVDEGIFDPKAVSRQAARQLLDHKDALIDAAVLKHWGDVKRNATNAEMRAEIGRLAATLDKDVGDPYRGKPLFVARCASCHVLHGRGSAVGPDLTPFNRSDTESLLLHIVNPSAEIREGYENHLVLTEDGRAVTGVLIEKDAQVVVIMSAADQRVSIRRGDISQMTVIGQSLMPENLLQGLDDVQVRDLFAYLRSSQPLNDRPK